MQHAAQRAHARVLGGSYFAFCVFLLCYLMEKFCNMWRKRVVRTALGAHSRAHTHWIQTQILILPRSLEMGSFQYGAERKKLHRLLSCERFSRQADWKCSTLYKRLKNWINITQRFLFGSFKLIIPTQLFHLKKFCSWNKQEQNLRSIKDQKHLISDDQCLNNCKICFLKLFPASAAHYWHKLKSC